MIITITSIWPGQRQRVRLRVSLTLEHPASHYRQPVMVFDDGTVLDAFNWLLSDGRAVKFENPEERELYKKWIESFPPVPDAGGGA